MWNDLFSNWSNDDQVLSPEEQSNSLEEQSEEPMDEPMDEPMEDYTTSEMDFDHEISDWDDDWGYE